MTTNSYQFDRETAIHRDGSEAAAPKTGEAEAAEFRTAVASNWNIGANPNGGYLAASSLRAMTEVGGQPDPLSVTTHFLRPGLGGQTGDIQARLVRPGRRSTTVSAELHQDGKQRIQVLGAFGDLSSPAPATADTDGADTDAAPTGGLTFAPVELPGPDDCVDRRLLEQGVDLPILDRLDVRIDPQWAVAGQSHRAEVSGYIRFADGRAVDTASLVLFADAFPPSVFSLLGTIGWVPTLELTVHVRRRPAPGWIRARFTTEDLSNGMLIENGDLWDSAGHLVARSRQLALLLQ